MHYSNEPNMVRVDFFKPGGKWYTTEAIKWDRYKCCEHATVEYEDLATTLKRCLREQLKPEGRLSDMVAVCLEPYHEHAHPQMVRNWMEV